MHDQGYITSEKEFKDAINTPLKDTLNLQDVDMPAASRPLKTPASSAHTWSTRS